MALYKTIINPFIGQPQLVPSNAVVNFKETVANFASLPVSGNTETDIRVTSNDGHLYVWSGTAWIDQGNFIDVTWDSLTGKPTSTPAEIDIAVGQAVTAVQPADIVDSGITISTDGTLAANSDTKVPTEKAVKTYADTKQTVLGFTPENIANKDTDSTLAANSDIKYPSQKAVKTYADTKVSSNSVADSGVSISTDGTLVGNSDTNVPTEKAVKTYVNNTTPSISNDVNPPSSTPIKLGDIFIDTILLKIYIATGTSSSSDWTPVN